LAKQKRDISTREVAFYGLQAIIPAMFAIVPVFLFAIVFGDLTVAARKLTDGTLVLISFTMLISLSQDLTPAVKPHQRNDVAKLELLLRIAAIVILAVYTLFQATSMLFLYEESTCAIPATATCSVLKGARPVLDKPMSFFSLYCFVLASLLALWVLRTLRPHFTDRN
jgi:hypothetical protein